MEKISAWFRRHKIIFFNIGILIGFTLIVWAYFNTPVNINRMTSADWQNFHAKEIGTETVQKLSAGAPYQSIEDINKISGIGPVKMAQIKRYFTTWDTAKSDVWYIGFFAGLILFFGGILYRYITEKDRKKAIKNFEQRLFGDKSVKR